MKRTGNNSFYYWFYYFCYRDRLVISCCYKKIF